jgi:nucleoside-diphosphate-sugar epimerase
VRRTDRHGPAASQRSKLDGERSVLDVAARTGQRTVVIRPAGIYGPGDTRHLKLFRAIARGRYAVVGSGLTFYHPVFIDDLVDGFLLALERPEAIGQTIILAGPRYVTQAELAATVARHTQGRVLPLPDPGVADPVGRLAL